MVNNKYRFMLKMWYWALMEMTPDSIDLIWNYSFLQYQVIADKWLVTLSKPRTFSFSHGEIFKVISIHLHQAWKGNGAEPSIHHGVPFIYIYGYMLYISVGLVCTHCPLSQSKCTWLWSQSDNKQQQFCQWRFRKPSVIEFRSQNNSGFNCIPYLITEAPSFDLAGW